jgi:SAM-dependent methyltransferase
VKGELSDRYRQFHEDREKHADFVYVPERVPLFVQAIGGPGLAVLDLGCRAGALSQHFLAGNEVTGVDVDESALGHAADRGLRTVWGDVEEPLPFEDGCSTRSSWARSSSMSASPTR